MRRNSARCFVCAFRECSATRSTHSRTKRFMCRLPSASEEYHGALRASARVTDALRNAAVSGFVDDSAVVTLRPPRFSFTLFERSNGANLLRVQTDNVDRPFDLNEGARLDLGSTAKFRTLVTY